MLRQLLRRGQVTIPIEMLKAMGLQEKDYVQIEQTDRGILIHPVSVVDYSPAEIEALRGKLDELPRGQKRVFQSLQETRKHLDSLKKAR